MVHPEQRNIGILPALIGLRDRGYQPEVVYDVGAATGDWSRDVREIWPEAIFVCFEPLEERAKDLETLRLSDPGKIVVYDVGLADVNQKLPMNVTDSLYDSSFAYLSGKDRFVQVKKLDDVIRDGAPQPSFLKIDVQGYERRVLEGGKNALQRVDFILMECQFIPFCEEMTTLDKTIAFMSSIDFIPYEFCDFLRRPLDGAMGQCDILFIKNGHALLNDRRWAES